MVIIRDSLNYLYTLLTVEGVFLVGFICLSIGFIINLVLSLSLKSYKRSKRRWFICLSLTVLLLQITFELNAGGNGALIALNSAIIIPMLYFSSLIKEKKADERAKQIELARYFDDKAYDRDKPFNHISKADFSSECGDGVKFLDKEDECAEQDLEKISPSNVKDLLVPKKLEEYNLDFTHVKNVLSRLDYYSLSPTDKRLVKELEITLAQAESGEFSLENKERLNDGLGSLLKIMAKYGV